MISKRKLKILILLKRKKVVAEIYKSTIKVLAMLLIIGTANAQDFKYEDRIYTTDVKSLQTFVNGQFIPLPIIRLKSTDRLFVQFDDLVESEDKDFNYRIIHCTRDWTPSKISEIDFLVGYNNEPLRNWEFSSNCFVQYVHYYLQFPNNDTQFNISGNYLLLIYDKTTNKPILTKRFMVVEDLVVPVAKFIRPTSPEQARYNHQFSLDVFLNNFKLTNPIRDVTATVIQNGNWNGGLHHIKPEFFLGEKLQFNNFGAISFLAGNEFRSFDTRTHYSRGRHVSKVDRQVTPIAIDLVTDHTRSPNTYSLTFDFNGKYFVNNLDLNQIANTRVGSSQSNRYNLKDLGNILEPAYTGNLDQFVINSKDFISDYAKVKFSLEYLGRVNEKYYVIGELTNWQIDPAFEMKYNAARDLYECETLIKQGFYDYAYATVTYDNKVNLQNMEGSWQETENDYTFLVYLREYGKRYDRLIGSNYLSSRF
jgi:hypothetical protein